MLSFDLFNHCYVASDIVRYKDAAIRTYIKGHLQQFFD